MVSWHEINFDAQNSLQVLPEVGLERVAVVRRDRVAGTIPGQPSPDEGVAAIYGTCLWHRYSLNPMRFSVNYG